MVMYWGSISCPLQNPSNFYEYQWRKHGSCTGMRKDRYFQKVMDLYFQYDLATAFQDAGIYIYMSLPILSYTFSKQLTHVGSLGSMLFPDKPKSKGHFTHGTESPWPITLKAFSLVEKAEPVQVFAPHYAWGTDGVCECKMHVKSIWIPTWYRVDHVFMVIWTIFKYHFLEVGLTQKPGETKALWMLTTVGLFYFMMCEDPHE